MNGKRAFAFFIDFLITAVIQNALFMYFVMYPIINKTGNSADGIFVKTIIITYISMCYMIFRDIPKGGSLGKQIAKIKIISSDTKNDAALSQRILRNVFWVLGPVEIFVYIIGSTKMGDLIANTEITAK